MHNWMFRRMKMEDVGKLALCEVEMDGLTPAKAALLRNLTADEFEHFNKLLTVQGHLQLAQLAFIGLDQAIKNMITSLGLDEEGKAFCGGDYAWLMGVATTLFSDVVSNEKRLIENMEKYLKEDFGSGSAEHIEWKTITSYLFDNDFIYSFCQGLRNVYQHEDFVLNCTAINQEEGSAYLVVNFEHEMLSKCLNEGIRHQIHQFIEVRGEASVPARRNIGAIIQVLYAQVAALYAYYIQTATTALDEHVFLVDRPSPHPKRQGNVIGVMAANVTRKGFPKNGLFIPYSSEECLRLKDGLTRKSMDDLTEIKKLALVG